MKKNNNSLSPFHSRLISILQDDVEGWAKKIGVSATNIRTNWFKGSYPGADKLIKIIELSGVSANLLLTGQEQKYNIPSNGYATREIQHIENSAAANKELNEYLKKENKELKRKVKNLTEEFQKFIKKHMEYRRREDPEDLDVAALRKYPKEKSSFD